MLKTSFLVLIYTLLNLSVSAQNKKSKSFFKSAKMKMEAGNMQEAIEDLNLSIEYIFAFNSHLYGFLFF